MITNMLVSILIVAVLLIVELVNERKSSITKIEQFNNSKRIPIIYFQQLSTCANLVSFIHLLAFPAPWISLKQISKKYDFNCNYTCISKR